MKTPAHLVGLAVLAAFALSSCGSGPDLDAAAKECSSESRELKTADDGDSLTVTGDNSGDGGGALVEAEANLVSLQALCVLNELDVPDSTLSKVRETRALDGTQTATVDGVELTWTYHPDDGLSLIVEK